MLNKGTHKNEDMNFEVQFHSRQNKAESFIKFFIEYFEKISKIETQINFSWIIDQKVRSSITKRNTFNIFRKGNKWIQIRYLLKWIEGVHQENATFIDNAVKGQFEAFRLTYSEKFLEFNKDYEALK